MLYFANLFTDEESNKTVRKLCEKYKDTKNLRRGIKACTKSIEQGKDGVLIIAADVSPPDSVSHMPLLAEEKNIPYIFCESMECLKYSNSFEKPTSCCFFVLNEKSKKMKALAEYIRVSNK